MFSYTKLEVQSLAQQYEYRSETLEKVLRLIDILRYIFSDKTIKNKLALKGGTAINLCFFDMKRISLDADLDYIGAFDKENMLMDRSIIAHKINEYVMILGYQENDKGKKTHALDSFDGEL